MKSKSRRWDGQAVSRPTGCGVARGPWTPIGGRDLALRHAAALRDVAEQWLRCMA